MRRGEPAPRDPSGRFGIAGGTARQLRLFQTFVLDIQGLLHTAHSAILIRLLTMGRRLLIGQKRGLRYTAPIGFLGYFAAADRRRLSGADERADRFCPQEYDGSKKGSP